MLDEVRDRDQRVKKLQKQQKQNGNAPKPRTAAQPDIVGTDAPISVSSSLVNSPATEPVTESEPETIKPKKSVPYVRVYDYEDLKRKAGLLWHSARSKSSFPRNVNLMRQLSNKSNACNVIVDLSFEEVSRYLSPLLH